MLKLTTEMEPRRSSARRGRTCRPPAALTRASSSRTARSTETTTSKTRNFFQIPSKNNKPKTSKRFPTEIQFNSVNSNSVYSSSNILIQRIAKNLYKNYDNSFKFYLKILINRYAKNLYKKYVKTFNKTNSNYVKIMCNSLSSSDCSVNNSVAKKESSNREAQRLIMVLKFKLKRIKANWIAYSYGKSEVSFRCKYVSTRLKFNLKRIKKNGTVYSYGNSEVSLRCKYVSIRVKQSFSMLKSPPMAHKLAPP